ncbi:hypothetical protein HBI56_024770 [Parastagonospora nodorum]|nr:hypothetical protein HBH56_023190 [Parastagonospora nodorum]KAH3934511.1 hypothetical protein HBH54_058860 [Parastagonospora nodorum]KAH3975918.1 hypothetical protein HBH51_079430 [Parastagonospora nodorum]KAH4005838.1 hypothetical protein HBI10_029910 [Parastagonospora nodorum]KAH4008158.1 hypothetical protein HBI13_240760 [Parastagonospora nodorum]
MLHGKLRIPSFLDTNVDRFLYEELVEMYGTSVDTSDLESFARQIEIADYILHKHDSWRHTSGQNKSNMTVMAFRDELNQKGLEDSQEGHGEDLALRVGLREKDVISEPRTISVEQTEHININGSVFHSTNNYKSLSVAGKRRARKQRLKRSMGAEEKHKATLCRQTNVPHDLRQWRNKRYKRGTDPYNTCHTCWQLFACGHNHHTLCYICDTAWDQKQLLKCPLHQLRRNALLKPETFILFPPGPCSICRDAKSMNARYRLRRLCNLPTHIRQWMMNADLLHLQDLLELDVDYDFELTLEDGLIRSFGVDEDELEKPLWDELDEWQLLVDDYRDFRRRSR